jgi:hypothetical protein
MPRLEIGSPQFVSGIIGSQKVINETFDGGT